MRTPLHNHIQTDIRTCFLIVSVLFSILAPPCLAAPSDWKTERWQGFSVSMPPDWNSGDMTHTQASWNFGDIVNGKYVFFGIFASHVQPQQMPLEKDATLVPQGGVILDGKSAKAYDITFSTGDRRHHLICLDQPDFEGNYLFIMAGVVGMDFQSHWPLLSNVMETVKYTPSPPQEPTLDPSFATETTTPSPALPPSNAPSTDTSDAPSMDTGTTPEGWKQTQWRNFSLAIPPEWEKLGEDDRDEMAWGVVDKDKKIGVTFGIVSQRKSLTQEKLEKWMTLEKEEQTLFLGKPAKIIEISGSPGKDKPEMHIRAITFDTPAANGKYIIFAGSVAGDSWEINEPIIQKIFASISGSPEEGVLETSQKKVEPFQMWDVVTFSPAPGWTSFGDKDGRLWMPVFKEEPQAVFMVMRGEKVDQTLSTMVIKTKEQSLLAGQDASFFTGTVSYYKAPVKVWVLDRCLASGERLGVLMGGTDTDVYQKQLGTMMASLTFNLSPECSPCQEMVTRNLQGISFKTPRYMKTRKWEKLGAIDCKGTDIQSGAEFSVWLRMNSVTYEKESGGYKDVFRVVKRFKVNQAAATEFYTSIGQDNDKHLSRLIELDQKLTNGKFLCLECYYKDAGHWNDLQSLIDPILSSLQVDSSLLADNAGEYRAQQTLTPKAKATADKTPAVAAAPSTSIDRLPLDTVPTSRVKTAVQGKLVRKKGFGDLVGQGEKPGFNASPDIIMRLTITAPERTITAMSIGIPGMPALWDTLPDNQAWLLGVGQKNKLKNNANGEISIQPAGKEQVFDLYLQDKHLFDRGKTDLWLDVIFADGEVWGTPLLEK